MTQTRYTYTLARADQLTCQSYARVTIVDSEGAGARDVLVTLWPPSTASPAPTLTGPTPRASTSGNARRWNWPKNEASSASPMPGDHHHARQPITSGPRIPGRILSRPG